MSIFNSINAITGAKRNIDGEIHDLGIMAGAKALAQGLHTALATHP